MGCAVGTVKFTVFIFNFILVCGGFALILYGAIDSPFPEDVKNIQNFISGLSLTTTFLIVVGAIIFLLAFFGCWGAVSDSSCMLFVYATTLMLLILAEVVVGVYVYAHRDVIKEEVSNHLKQWMQEYNNQTSAKQIIDNIQTKLKCCGVDSANDWNKNGLALPPSCCQEETGSSKADRICPASEAYKEGCLEKSLRLIKEQGKRYWLIAGCIIAVQLLTILFALIVRNSIINEERRNLA